MEERRMLTGSQVEDTPIWLRCAPLAQGEYQIQVQMQIVSFGMKSVHKIIHLGIHQILFKRVGDSACHSGCGTVLSSYPIKGCLIWLVCSTV